MGKLCKVTSIHPKDFASLKKAVHNSRPRNPKIAIASFKAGYIDTCTWGRGTLKIINSCKEAELPETEIIEKDGDAHVTVFKDNVYGGQVDGRVGGQVSGQFVKNNFYNFYPYIK